MACSCIALVDAELAEHNARIDQASIRSWTEENPRGSLTQRVRLTTVKLDTKKRKKMGAVATYCPFCGTRYLPE